jgi:hypothetical protein
LAQPWVLGLIGVATVVLIWLLTTASGAVDKLFLPSPQAVWQAGQAQWQSGVLLKDAVASIQRVFIGFALSAGLALPVGIAMGTNPTICRLLEPLMALIRYMPASTHYAHAGANAGISNLGNFSKYSRSIAQRSWQMDDTRSRWNTHCKQRLENSNRRIANPAKPQRRLATW